MYDNERVNKSHTSLIQLTDYKIGEKLLLLTPPHLLFFSSDRERGIKIYRVDG
jgi:hypothetical protein